MDLDICLVLNNYLSKFASGVGSNFNLVIYSTVVIFALISALITNEDRFVSMISVPYV